MSDKNEKKRVIGLKQSRRAILEGRAAEVIIASDIDPHIRDQIISLCREASVAISHGGTKSELGAKHGIEVGASIVTELK
ncbi:MAG: ribosomal L7Ae/L30e/S12e/Gadd45 family protein [Oscillospiraceae bacterium]|jgi:large subunit ribosomal protein L7A